MPPTLVHIMLLAGGIALLAIGGDTLIKASVTIAHKLGVSTLLIGLTVVAFGTSAPELAFNTIASANGNDGLVFGNVVGSNICNIGLILGIAAFLQPMVVHTDLVRREIPIMIGAALLMGVLAVVPLGSGPERGYGRPEGVLMLALMLGYAWMSVAIGLRQRAQTATIGESIEEVSADDLRRPLRVAVGLVIVALAMLTGGAKMTEMGAVGLARGLGIPDAIIGLTIVAVGTSLPELAATVVAARKRQSELAIGNIVGSNIFNVLTIFGVSAVISPVELPEGAWVSLGVMIALSVSLVVLSRTRSGRVSRFEGGVLLAAYAAYIAFQGYEAFAAQAGSAAGGP